MSTNGPTPVSRRQALKGALAVSSVAGLPGIAAARSGGTLLVHDPELIAGQRLVKIQGGEVLPIEGDRIRFARAVFEQRPSLVIGVSRPADALQWFHRTEAIDTDEITDAAARAAEVERALDQA